MQGQDMEDVGKQQKDMPFWDLSGAPFQQL